MDSHIKTASFLAKLLDEQFSIFGFKFGLDPILGLAYGVGDVLSFALGIYIIWIARQTGLPQAKMNKMLLNATIDFLLGLVPIAGQASDFFYKSNKMNMEILQEHVGGGFYEAK